MKIKWLGHSSFLITSGEGVKVITDPYPGGEELGYPAIRESADIVTVSHDHFDHNNTSAVRENPEVITGGDTDIKGINVRSVASWHDDEEGKSRGKNNIFCIGVSGVNVCHLGDLGHTLSEKQVAEIGPVDILLIPVGGHFTIDAAGATRVCNQLSPSVVIPMHYRNRWCRFPISGVDDFLAGKEDVVRMEGSEVEFSAGSLPAGIRIVVLEPRP